VNGAVAHTLGGAVEQWLLPVYGGGWVVATYDRRARNGWRIEVGPFRGRGNQAVHFALLDGAKDE
jgi:hypothetical protein